MQPHDENWDLEPANGHANAQSLLAEAYYWDCTDDNSPLGNDTGADILAFYSEALANDPNLNAVTFLESVLESWEMLIGDWSLADEGTIVAQLADDPHTIRTSNDAAIALAFGMYVMHGHVDPRVRDMALTAIERESTDALVSGWSSPDERRQRLADFKEKLKHMKEAK